MSEVIKADQLSPQFMGQDITIKHEGNEIRGELTDLYVNSSPRIVLTNWGVPVGFDTAIEATVDGSFTVRCFTDDTITINDLEDTQ